MKPKASRHGLPWGFTIFSFLSFIQGIYASTMGLYACSPGIFYIFQVGKDDCNLKVQKKTMAKLTPTTSSSIKAESEKSFLQPMQQHPQTGTWTPPRTKAAERKKVFLQPGEEHR